MNTNLKYITAAFAALPLFGAAPAQATDISGTITATVTITQDSRLTGDVTCSVTGAPCIQFGAAGIELRLDGHVMTGNGARDSCPSSTPKEDGIFTNGQLRVAVLGPGIVRRFRQRAIEVTGNESVVKGVTVLSTCQEGILVGGAQNLIEDNSVSRASLGAAGDASIWVQGTGGHLIRRNEVSTPGSLTPSGQGIFVGSGTPSKNNRIEQNSASGIPGTGLFFTAGSTGNYVARNQFLGNLIFVDITDPNPFGTNIYEDNLCETSQVGTPTPTNVCEVPDIAGHQNPRARDDDDWDQR